MMSLKTNSIEGRSDNSMNKSKGNQNYFFRKRYDGKTQTLGQEPKSSIDSDVNESKKKVKCSFLPFLKERDGMNRLIKTESHSLEIQRKKPKLFLRRIERNSLNTVKEKVSNIDHDSKNYWDLSFKVNEEKHPISKQFISYLRTKLKKDSNAMNWESNKKQSFIQQKSNSFLLSYDVNYSTLDKYKGTFVYRLPKRRRSNLQKQEISSDMGSFQNHACIPNHKFFVPIFDKMASRKPLSETIQYNKESTSSLEVNQMNYMELEDHHKVMSIQEKK